jgi:multidrug resistance efflux pump
MKSNRLPAHQADAEINEHDGIPVLPALGLTMTTGPARWLARSLLSLLVLILIGLSLTPWQQNVAGYGRVVAFAPIERQQTLQAPVEGRVLHWWVKEGSIVNAGDRIADITDYDPELMRRLEAEQKTLAGRIVTIQTRIAELQNQSAMAVNSRAMALSGADSRIRMAEQRLKAARHALEAADAALTTSELNFKRQETLQGKGLSSTRSYELALLEVTQRRTETDRARATLEAATSEVEAIRADRQKSNADTQSTMAKANAELAKSQEELAYAQAEKLKLDTRQARQKTQTVKAPRPGTILRLAVSSQAEVVKPGDPLAVLIPSTQERAVELWMDGNDIPLITPGRKVRLQFEGYPALQFSGWPEVAVGTFGGEVSLIDATDNGKGDFRILVLPDPNDLPWPSDRFIRQGVRVNGWVLLNQVRLGYELWRIFNGFPPVYLPSHPELKKSDPAFDKSKLVDGEKDAK